MVELFSSLLLCHNDNNYDFNFAYCEFTYILDIPSDIPIN